MSARPGPCGGHRVTGVPTAIDSYDIVTQLTPWDASSLLLSLLVQMEASMALHRVVKLSKRTSSLSYCV
jgi:hypothetical protein